MTRTCHAPPVLRVAFHVTPLPAAAVPDPVLLAILAAGCAVRRRLPPGSRVRLLPGGALAVVLPGGLAEPAESLAQHLAGALELADARVRIEVRVWCRRRAAPTRGERRHGPPAPPGAAARLLPLLHALDLKDGYTAGHSARVARLAAGFARWLGWPAEELADAQWAGLAHDLGKLRVPASILTKPGPLTPQERAVILRHPIWSARILLALGAPARVVEAVLAHHERWDGYGYPHGRPGPAIPPLAQVVALADAFDAMTSVRSYATAKAPGDALADLEQAAGSQFAPDLAREFVRYVRARADEVAAALRSTSAPSPAPGEVNP